MESVDISPDRAARAAEALRDGHVRIEEREGPDEYVVRSFTRARSYRVQIGEEASCTCPDAAYRGGICKHLVAIALVVGLGGK